MITKGAKSALQVTLKLTNFYPQPEYNNQDNHTQDPPQNCILVETMVMTPTAALAIVAILT
jgi:hypothetical protein